MSAPGLLAVAAVSIALGVPVIAAGVAADASLRAAGVADAAALAAADAASGWIAADPCELVESIAGEADIEVVSCAVELTSGEARVVVRVDTMFGWVTARAHAAPRTAEAGPA